MENAELSTGMAYALSEEYGLSEEEIGVLIGNPEDRAARVAELAELSVLIGQLDRKGRKNFWHRESKYLGGRAPLEVAAEEGSLGSVRQAARRRVSAWAAKRSAQT